MGKGYGISGTPWHVERLREPDRTYEDECYLKAHYDPKTERRDERHSGTIDIKFKHYGETVSFDSDAHVYFTVGTPPKYIHVPCSPKTTIKEIVEKVYNER